MEKKEAMTNGFHMIQKDMPYQLEDQGNKRVTIGK